MYNHTPHRHYSSHSPTPPRHTLTNHTSLIRHRSPSFPTPSPPPPPHHTNHKRRLEKTEHYRDKYPHNNSTSCESAIWAVKRQRLSPQNIPTTTTSDKTNRVIKQEHTSVERITYFSPYHNNTRTPLKLSKKRRRIVYTEIDSVMLINDVKDGNDESGSRVLSVGERSNKKAGIKSERLYNEKQSEMTFITTNGHRDCKRQKSDASGDEMRTSCHSTPEISPVHKRQRKSRLSSGSQNTNKKQRQIESYFHNRDITPPLQVTTPTNEHVYTNTSPLPHKMRTPTKSDHSDEELFMKTPSWIKRESGTSSSSYTPTLSGKKLSQCHTPHLPHLQNSRTHLPPSSPPSYTLSSQPHTPIRPITTISSKNSCETTPQLSSSIPFHPSLHPSENKTTEAVSSIPSKVMPETTPQLSPSLPSPHHTCTSENKTTEAVPSKVMHETSTSHLLPSLSSLSLHCTSEHRATIPSWSETELNTKGEARSGVVSLFQPHIPGLDVDGGCVACPATTSTCNYLEVYMQMTARHQRDDKKFVETLEEIIVAGRCIPYAHITAVLRCVLKISDSTLLIRLHSLLASDASSRPTVISSTWPHQLWEVMEKCCRRFLPHTISSSTSSSTPHYSNSAHVVLLYLVTLLAADMTRHHHTTTVPLLERILSLTTRWQHVKVIVDLVFQLLVNRHDNHQLPLPELLPVMTKLLCMCISTSSVNDRDSVATRLAREISSRLSKLPSIELKIHLLLLLPCHLLREKIISIHLQTEFLLLPSDSLCGGNNILPSENVTLDLISTTHLCRCPCHHDGTPQDLAFFLSLLFHLLLSHYSRLLGFSPINPSPSLPTTLTPYDLAKQLQPISHQIKILSRRLSEDDGLLLELTTPNCWFYLQLLDSMFKWNHVTE